MLTLTISTKKENDSYDRRKKVQISFNFHLKNLSEDWDNKIE